MLQQIFTSPSDATEKSIVKLRPRKGVIIGAGQVGLACAYSLLIQNTLDELVMVDINQKKLECEVMDLLHGSPFIEPTTIKAGSFADGIGDDADVVIITAGAKQLPGETRLDLMQRNAELFKNLIPKVFFNSPPIPKMCGTFSNPGGKLIGAGTYPLARRRVKMRSPITRTTESSTRLRISRS